MYRADIHQEYRRRCVSHIWTMWRDFTVFHALHAMHVRSEIHMLPMWIVSHPIFTRAMLLLDVSRVCTLRFDAGVNGVIFGASSDVVLMWQTSVRIGCLHLVGIFLQKWVSPQVRKCAQRYTSIFTHKYFTLRMKRWKIIYRDEWRWVNLQQLNIIIVIHMNTISNMVKHINKLPSWTLHILIKIPDNDTT